MRRTILRHSSLTHKTTSLISTFTLYQRLRDSINKILKISPTPHDGDSLSPRTTKERNELYFHLLANTYHRMRRNLYDHDRHSSLSYCDKQNQSHTHQHLKRILEEATKTLDELNLDDLSIRTLRYELQSQIQDDWQRLFHAFVTVEELLMNVQEEGEESCMGYCKIILLEEYDKETRKDGPFHRRKREAIETLASYHNWKVMCPFSSNHKRTHSRASMDAFGYFPHFNPQLHKGMRYHQTLNLTKSMLLKQQLGYSVLTLQSLIPNAGRGVFVDGHAFAGSIVGFMPGVVWPKEYLTKNNNNVRFQGDDPNYQLSLRYDDILIDSRFSPITNLAKLYCNPFAIGHVMNHPSKLTTNNTNGIPNCKSIMLDLWTRTMKSQSSIQPLQLQWERYVPNTYAKSPSFWGPAFFDREMIHMHAMGLMACRDVGDEELVYNYRLSGEGSYPEWYHGE